MKEYTDQQIQDIIKLKFGKMVTSANHTSYISNRILGKLYGVSGSKVRRLYMDYFAAANKKEQSLMQRLQEA